jgi:D-3-phosphoglycerate dehydrogenase intervening domain
VSRLKPLIGLIDKLGAFAGQNADDALQAIEIEYEAEVSHLNTQPPAKLITVRRNVRPQLSRNIRPRWDILPNTSVLSHL